MSFMRGNAVTKMRLLVKAGVIQKPAWLEALEMAPPLPVPKVKGKAPKLVLDEDPYIQSYYSRFPRAKYLEPFRVNSFDPPLARIYAWRQMELMEKGLSKKEARDKADEEILPLQEEEEEAVLQMYRQTASGGNAEELEGGIAEELEGDLLDELYWEDLEMIKKGLRENASRPNA